MEKNYGILKYSMQIKKIQQLSDRSKGLYWQVVESWYNPIPNTYIYLLLEATIKNTNKWMQSNIEEAKCFFFEVD